MLSFVGKKFFSSLKIWCLCSSPAQLYAFTHHIGAPPLGLPASTPFPLTPIHPHRPHPPWPQGPGPMESRAQPAWLMYPPLPHQSLLGVGGHPEHPHGQHRAAAHRAAAHRLPMLPSARLMPAVTAPATVSWKRMGSLRLSTRPLPQAPVWPPPLTGLV